MNYEDILCGVVSVSGKQGPAGPVGPQGEPGYGSAYLGPTQPDNPNITIWYDTSGEEVIIKIKQNGEWVVAVDWTNYATQTWVEQKGYQTAADVSTIFDNKIPAIFSFNAETGRLDITV